MREPAADPDLEEIFAALRLRPGNLRPWLEDRRRVCAEHGGERYYGDLLALIDACLARVAEREGEEKGC